MMGVRGPLAIAVATVMVFCTADPRQEQDVRVEHSGSYIPSGHKPRNLDPLGGGNLIREVREPHRPYYVGRRYEYGSGYGAPIEYGYLSDLPKRNFDEIDRSYLDNFAKKRNFDEIDQTSMPFPFKRFYHLYGSNNLDVPVSSFDKKRYRPDFPMDEIDLSQFPIGSKRSETRHL